MVVGARSGGLDEELAPRAGVNASDPSKLYLAQLERQPGRGALSRVGDAAISAFTKRHDPAAAAQLAETILPAEKRSVRYAGLPAAVRTSVFKHGAGPMASITFYRTKELQPPNGSVTQTLTIQLTSLLGKEWARQDVAKRGEIELQWHNLPLGAEADPVVTLDKGDYKRSADGATVTLTLKKSIGALSVLSIAAPAEGAARAAAARLRKAKERLGIALRAAGAPGLSPSDNYVTDAETLLSYVQCGGAPHWWMSKVCSSYIDQPPLFRKLIATKTAVMTAALEARLAATTAATLSAQSSGRAAVLAAAKTAVLALDFGGVSAAAAIAAPWSPVGALSAYSKAQGYGFTSELGQVNASAPNPQNTYGAPFTDYLFGGAADASFAVDLPAGDYAVTAVVGSYEENFKVAATGLRDGSNRTLFAGMAGARVRAGIWSVRTMSAKVVATSDDIEGSGQLRLRLTGQPVGPQLSIDNNALSTEHAFYTKTGWLLSALLVHAAAAAPSLPAAARASLKLHSALAAGGIRDWAIVGPFNDSASTGMWRNVSAADLAPIPMWHPCRVAPPKRGVPFTGLCMPHTGTAAPLPANVSAADLDAMYAGKVAGSVVRWRRWSGGGSGSFGSYAVPVARAVRDDAWGSGAVLQTFVKCERPTRANVSFSTAGVGQLSIWQAPQAGGAKGSTRQGGPLLWSGRDEVYAGLFDTEVSAEVALQAGWSVLQLKTLSHYSTAEGWEAAASLMFAEGETRCKVDACGGQPDAAMCKKDSA